MLTLIYWDCYNLPYDWYYFVLKVIASISNVYVPFVQEYQKGNANLVVENADMNNVVYMFRCRDSALTVKGKVNGVVLDSCTKCAVVFDNLVSSIEFVNCQSVQMQVSRILLYTLEPNSTC